MFDEPLDQEGLLSRPLNTAVLGGLMIVALLIWPQHAARHREPAI